MSWADGCEARDTLNHWIDTRGFPPGRVECCG
jgi:hypothetical protein